MTDHTPGLTPFIWFNDQAREAADFYLELFDDAEEVSQQCFGDECPPHAKPGDVFSVSFRLRDQLFTAFNGGPTYELTPALSWMLYCDDQREIDHYWHAFAEQGQPMMCGWVTDRFNVTWQVVPRKLSEMLDSPDKAAAHRTWQAMMDMQKIELVLLEAAFADNGASA